MTEKIEHTALACGTKIIGVFRNDDPRIACFPLEGEAILANAGLLYVMDASKERYDEWRKFIEGRSDVVLDYYDFKDTLDNLRIDRLIR